MRLGEALARCPELRLVPPDPERAEAAWEGALRRLEGIGAAVEPGASGRGLLRGGRPAWALGEAWRGSLQAGAERRSDPACGSGRARPGSAPTRPRCKRATRRAPVIVPAAMRAPSSPRLPVGLLRDRLPGTAPPSAAEPRRRRAPALRICPRSWSGSACRTLGQLAALPDAAIADRFGEAGLRALRMARGEDEPLRPRRAHEELVERLELPEAISGPQLERALALLIDRLLANPARRGRSLRRLRLGARLAGGGSWRSVVALRRASADPSACGWRCSPKLAELPGPAASLSLQALETGPPAGDQPTLAGSARQRAAQAARRGGSPGAGGRRAGTRCCGCSRSTSESRVPERRLLLTPFRRATNDPRARTRPCRLARLPPVTAGVVLAAAGRGRGGIGRGAERGRVGGGGGGARGVAGRGPLVDAAAAAPPLLRAGAGRRAQRGRLPRAGGGGPLVPAEGMSEHPARGTKPGTTAATHASARMPREYVELHCHSAFSFLDGASAPEELARRGGELGYPALALTDHDGVWGAMEFAQACKALGVRPIVGAELTVTPGPPPFHLTLLAEDATGWRNLCRLVTEAHRDTRPGPQPLPPPSRSPRSRGKRRASSASRAAPAMGRSRAPLGRRGSLASQTKKRSAGG